ncbi:MAG: PD-(D/E)XK nuclease family protein [Acidimicrobiales bacterium]
MALVEIALNPAQRDVLAVLGAPRDAWPSFRTELRLELLADLEDGLAPVVARLAALHPNPSPPLGLTKHTVAAVLGCEARFLHDDRLGFPGWSAPLARGAVAHKAIELSVHARGPWDPLRLVDEAVARLAENENGLGDWLQRLSEIERAELRAIANDHVAKFLECWPPLRAAWRPVTESRWRAELCDDRVVLAGRADLTLQQPEGSVARKVVVDLKTGGFAPSHLDDLRFYALLETLRLGTPPRLVATYYLESGRFVHEAVTEEALSAATARVVEAGARLVELRLGARDPVYRPGPACRWCPLLQGCDVGGRALADRDDWP